MVLAIGATVAAALPSLAYDMRNQTYSEVIASQGTGWVDYLMNQGIGIDGIDKNMMTMLMAAAETGDLDAAKSLIRNGANVNLHEPQLRISIRNQLEQRKYAGLSALGVAIKNNQIPMIKFLLEHKATIDIEYPRTGAEGILRFCVTDGTKDAFETVVPYIGAGLLDEQLYLALEGAVASNSVSLCNYLIEKYPASIEHDTKCSLLISAARNGSNEAATVLISHWKDLCVGDSAETGLGRVVENIEAAVDAAKDAKNYKLVQLLIDARERWESNQSRTDKEKELQEKKEAEENDPAVRMKRQQQAEKAHIAVQEKVWKDCLAAIEKRNYKQAHAYFERLSTDPEDLEGEFLKGKTYDFSLRVGSDIQSNKGRLVILSAGFESATPNGLLVIYGNTGKRLMLSGLKKADLISGESFYFAGVVTGTYTYRTVAGSEKTVPSIKFLCKL